jgi:hypothetical protein
MNYLMDYRFLIPLGLFLGLAPFVPQPHIVEKLRMLAAGDLKKAIDIFDLLWHAWPFALLAYKFIHDRRGQP